MITGVKASPNPSAVYCQNLGYDYEINNTLDGEIGVCIFEDDVYDCTQTDGEEENCTLVKKGIKCNAWDFLNGKCGQEYSYCEKNGYGIKTLSDGKNPMSEEYAVCIIKPDQELKSASIEIALASNTPKEQSSEYKPITDFMNLLDDSSFEDNKNEIRKSEERVRVISTQTVNKKEDERFVSSSAPSSFDWRSKEGYNWLTPIKSQGSCGSCWSFATIGGVESQIKISENDPNYNVDLSEQYLVSDCCVDCGDCDGGWNGNALEFIQYYGVSDELCYPYTAMDSSCSNRCSNWDSRLWKIDNFEYSAQDRDSIKQLLVDKGPLISSMTMAGSFDGNNVYRCNGNTGGWHAIDIVGYNDAGGYWIVRNSWGSDWGPFGNGYFYVGYGECYLEGSNKAVILENKQEDNYYASSVNAVSGTSSGSLSKLNTNDNNYVTLTEDCGLFGCNNMNIEFNFPLSNIEDVSSINLVADQQARWENGFSFGYRTSSNPNTIESLSDSKWDILKYNFCDSLEECSDFLNSNSNLYIRYSHPSCTFCDTDYVDIDMLRLETIYEEPEPSYCDAHTTNGDMEYISMVSLNEGYQSSSSSVYSDFSNDLFTTLARGAEYTITVRGTTDAVYTEYVKAWIDFNNDKQFSASEEIDLGSATFEGENYFYGTFQVPMDAQLSETNMRVYLKYGEPPSVCEIASYGEVEDYKVAVIEDKTPPWTSVSGAGAGYVFPGEEITINAWISDNVEVDSAYAEVKSYDDSETRYVNLYDDGIHNDGSADDGYYGNTWQTDSEGKDYYLNIYSEDIFGNGQIYFEIDKFTTKPFIKSSDIILVNNYKGSSYIEDSSYISYFEEALNYNGYFYDLWDYDLRGELQDSDLLQSYDNCIWSNPLNGPSYSQQNILTDFLNAGGNLFISGQDVGYSIWSSSFYKDYLHANYTQDDTNLYGLDGVFEDLLTGGMSLNIAGGDGANNQWYPDEVEAISPAEPIFYYNSLATEEPKLSIPEDIKKTLNKTDEREGEPKTGGIVSSGTGAIKVDMGLYKIVYLAFGFEAINNEYDRNELMGRVLDWFIDLDSPEISVYRLGDDYNYTFWDEYWGNNKTIEMGVDTSELVKWIKVYLDDNEYVSCTDCNNVLTTLRDLTEGNHTLKIDVVDYSDNSANKTINFHIDTIIPELNVEVHNRDFADLNFVGPNSPAVIDYNFNDANLYYRVFAIGDLIEINDTDENVEGLLLVSYLPEDSGSIIWNAKQYRLSNGAEPQDVVTIYFVEDIYAVDGRLCSYQEEPALGSEEKIKPEDMLTSPQIKENIKTSAIQEECEWTEAMFDPETLEFLGFSGTLDYNDESVFYYSSNNDSDLNLSIGEGLSLIDEDVDNNKSFDVYLGGIDYADNINYTTKSLISDNSPPVLEGVSPINNSTLDKLDSITFNLSDVNEIDQNIEINILLNGENFSNFEISDDSLENQIIINWDRAQNGKYDVTLRAKDILNNVGEYNLALEDLNNFKDVETNVEDLIFESNDIENETAKEINFNANNETLVSFNWDYNLSDMDFSLISIIKQGENSTEGSLIISGIDLTDQNQTKTVIVDKISTTADRICIKDSEVASISEVSDQCDGENEISLVCPGTSGEYSCNLTANNTKYIINGLKHSAIKEYKYIEPTSPPSNGGGSGGGGGGGGGGGSSTTATNPKTDNSAVASTGDATPEENNGETNLADENQTPQEESPSIWQRILNFFRGEPTGAAITGAAIGEDGQSSGKGNFGIVIIALVVIAGIAGVLIWHNKKKSN